MDYRLRRYDGQYQWIRDIGVPRFNQDGSFAGYMGIGFDISDRRGAEQERDLALERLRLAMKSGKSVGWDLDVKTGRDSWFGDLQTLFGMPSDTFFGQVEDFYRRVHPEDRERVAKAVQDAKRSRKPYAADFRIVQPDGTIRWVSADGTFYYGVSGEPERMLGMAVDITERKRTEEALRESEERLRLAAQAGKMYAYEWDIATNTIVRSSESVKILGVTSEPASLTREQVLERVHPEDRARFVVTVSNLTPQDPICHLTYRWLLPDGAVIWLEKSARAFFDEQGRMVRMIGMVADVTEEKRAEEALSGVSRRLIEAQERERARIARELHDDIAQRLALVAIELQHLQQNPPSSTVETSSRVDEFRKRITEISTDVQALSHELHSPKLEYLGIVAAIRGFCSEFGEQNNMEINFESNDPPTPLPVEVSLSLFRVLQEAAHNAVKYSRVQRLVVRLWATAREIHLTVSDFGEGFDAAEAIRGRGLGLTSMRERLHLVKGELSIDSAPKRGTTIHARVPLTDEGDKDESTSNRVAS
jgi:PAS domain S-box-containing protein